MFDDIRSHDLSCSYADDRAAPLRIFVGECREALINAAALLAGPHGERLVLEIAKELADGAGISRRCRQRLYALLDILALENVHDLDREESGYFALLDPASAVVEELCLLTDGYRNALEQAELASRLAKDRLTARPVHPKGMRKLPRQRRIRFCLNSSRSRVPGAVK